VGKFPSNLIVRVSAPRIDDNPPRGFANTSTVVTEGATCPAPHQGETVRRRACWDPGVGHVSYWLH
jgi:hypothetical protein